MFKIPGYKPGANITLLNVMYHKPKKDVNGKYDTGSLDIIFKDLDTNKKKLYHINDPEYTYYVVDRDYATNYNRLFVDKKHVHEETCKFRELKKHIAAKTGNLEYYFDNLKSGNARANDKLFAIPSIFNADMGIEDYYRFLFNKTYLNAQFSPTKLYFDIEVDGINQRGDFPELGECPVNAITLVDDNDHHVYTLLLNNDKNPLIKEFSGIKHVTIKLKQFVQKAVGGWKREKRFNLDLFDYKIMFYDDELKLIHDAFNIINIIKPDFALAWNIAFDLPYLIERIKVLGYDPADIICHPDFKIKEAYYHIDKRADKFEERGDFAQISAYTVYLDQLITFASRRKGQRAVSSFKLDYVGTKFAKVKKLDYSHITTSISKLPYLDYKTFVFYNVMDTIVQLCVEHEVGDVDFVFNKALLTGTRYSKVHRQTTYLANRGIADFDKMGYVMGCNTNKENQKTGFPGAFVADPLNISNKPRITINGIPVNLYDNLNDFDYAALYPSIIDENNMAPNTQHGRVFFPEQLDPRENRFNNEYFDRSVWFIEDLISHNRLDFCERYLNLAGYEQMYFDIIEYFNTMVNAMAAPRIFNSITGKRNMTFTVDNKKPMMMCYTIDPKVSKLMAFSQKRMVSIDDKNDS